MILHWYVNIANIYSATLLKIDSCLLMLVEFILCVLITLLMLPRTHLVFIFMH